MRSTYLRLRGCVAISVQTEASRRLQQTRWAPGTPLRFALWFPLAVYIVSRLVTAVFLVVAAGPGGRSGYAELATTWDGEWYRQIAAHGYPSSLPVNLDGRVEPNAWAFSPLYPLTVRALMALTGLDFSFVAPTLSLLLGAAATVVLFVLLERAVSRFYACAVVVLTCTFMAAPVMQIGYTESLALLLLVSALLLLRERRYIAVAALLLLLALTRPVLLAFIPVVAAHGVSRWRAHPSDPFPTRDRSALVLLTGWCIATTALWPVIVGLVTKDVFGWTKTHDAWQTPPRFAAGLGWPESFLFHFGWLAVAMLAFVVILTLGMGLRTGARAWGPELRAWAVAYPAYLLLATTPGASAIRWMLLAFPLMWPFPEMATTSAERRLRTALIAGIAFVGLVMQWVWVTSFLAASPPSGLYP
jgi:hypothetical protein